MATTKYCDITDWCRDSISDSDQSFSQSTIDCHTDTLTNILCTEFKLVTCADPAKNKLIDDSDCEDFCGNDRQTYLLWTTGDLVALQFQFKNNWDSGSTQTARWSMDGGDVLIGMEAVNCCDDSDTLDVANFVYGSDYYTARQPILLPGGGIIYNDLQGIRLDFDSIGMDCFKLKITIHEPGGATADYYTLPFRKVTCQHKGVIYLRSNYGYVDTMGNYYRYDGDASGIIGNFFGPYCQIKLDGEFLLVNGTIEQTLVNENKYTTESQLIKRYRARFKNMNENAALLMMNVCNGKNLIVNDITCYLDGAIDKNFDLGKDWSPDVNFKSYVDKTDYTCS